MSATPGAPSLGNDADAWQILSPLLTHGGYLPWTSGSMRPVALVEVCNEIVHGARTRIVECGAGVSTVLLARLLRERGAGTITSIEHDKHWAGLISAQLQREELGDNARVLHAPLASEPAWYELEEPTDPIDLLIVDGPPAFDPGHEMRRGPALQHFETQLVSDAVVILDDLDRPGEQRVVASWEASSPWRFELNLAAGIALGRRNA